MSTRDGNKETTGVRKINKNNKKATVMSEIKEQIAVKESNPEKVYKEVKTNKSMVFDHKRYVDVLGWVKEGLSSTAIIVKMADEYGYTLTSASTYFYQIMKYWRTLFKQEDVDLLRYTLREKYETIVETAMAVGDLKEARASLDSVRRMFGLDKQEVEVVNKEIKFKFEGVPELNSTSTELEDINNDTIEVSDEE